jgi:hypothetical protein
LKAREKSLRAHEQKLDEMLAAKKDLEVQVEQLGARVKTLQAAETVSTLEIDDSELTRVKKLIRELNKQLDVKEKMLDAEGKFVGLIPVESTATEMPAEKITEEIDAYFNTKQPSAEAPSVAVQAEKPAL